MSNMPDVAEYKSTLTNELSNGYWRALEDYRSDLTGKLLTLADAMMSDEIQRKAFKDLIKQSIDLTINKLHKANNVLIDVVGDIVGDNPNSAKPLMVTCHSNEDYRTWITVANMGYTYSRNAK